MAPDANTPELDDLDNYFLEGDLDDDPFASPKGDKSGSNKRKAPGDGLGLDEEVSVAKKPREPRIKLDQDRLLSDKGLPALRRRARDLKLKGKGHEWGDASRLLSFYQEWLDDLFPKAKFLDALAMVEKAGHNKRLQVERVELINKGKPKTSVIADGEEATEPDQQKDGGTHRQAERVAPIFDKAAGGRPRTPELDDLFGGEDDIYNATPIGARRNVSAVETGGEPDDDELDALMAEEEASEPKNSAKAGSGSYQSIFGGRKPTPAPAAAAASAEVDADDDLDALMAEAEAEQVSRQKPAMAPENGNKAGPPKSAGVAGAEDDEDDLDALMAEAEAQSRSAKPSASGPEPPAAKQGASEFNDEEDAMAEMEGLW